MRTKDVDFINSVMKHPDVFPWICDDGTNDPESFDVDRMVDDDRFYFISPNEWTVFANYPVNSITWEIQTPCQKLISWVPEPYSHVLRYAKTCGMKVEGISKKSFLKKDEVHDMALVGLSKGEWQCQQQQWEQ